MTHPKASQNELTRRFRNLALHVMGFIALFAVGIFAATLRGALWPFDPRFSALIAAGGIAVLAIAWWPAALVIGAVAALLARMRWRILFWPVAVLCMIALHAAFGPRLGFMPLNDLTLLGALRLYAIPVALPILIGSLFRDTLFPRRVSHALFGN